MLKAVQQTYQDQERESIQFRRESQVVEIRKQKREVQFKKRRSEFQRNYRQHQKTPNSQQQVFLNRRKIVDPNLQQQIKMLIKQQYTIEMLPQLSGYLESQDILKVHKGVIGIRKLLVYVNFPIESLLNLQIQDKLIKLTKSPYPQIQLESAWSLANLTFQNAQKCQILIQKGIIQCLFDLLKSKNMETVEQAIWGIGNLSCDLQVRKSMLEYNGIEKIIDIVNKFADQKLVQQACWGIASLTRGNPPPQYKLVQQGILFLCCLIENECIKDLQILTACIVAISCHCQKTKDIDKGKNIRKTEIIQKIIHLMLGCNNRLVLAILRFIGNFSTGEDQVANLLFSVNLLEYIQKCLYHYSVNIRQECCWILSNLAAGPEKQVKFILNHEKLISKLINMLIWDQLKVKKQIIFIFGNMSSTCGNYPIQEFYCKYSILDSIVELLKSQNPNLIMAALRNLNIILKKAANRNKLDLMRRELFRNEGVVILESLQFQEHRIYVEVSRIFKNYFQCEEQVAV